MRVIVLLVLVGAAIAVPSVVRTPTRIVGGAPTTIDKYPFMVIMQIHFFETWLQWCGGSLLNNRVVLSAAHCYLQHEATQLRAFLGTSLSQPDNGENVPNHVQRVRNHPEYSDYTLDNDIAVLWLSDDVVFSDVIRPARIAGRNYHLPDNTLLTTVGWGLLWDGGDFPEVLQEVDTYIINQELCVERYAYLKTLPGFEDWADIAVTDAMICTGILDVGGKDACQGDSGGPLLHGADIIVGVVSWGYSCAHALYPGVYARVSYFSDWIVENAQ